MKSLLLTLFAFSAFAQQPTPEQPDLQGHYQIEDRCGITVSGSLLYWKAYEEGLEYVIENTGASGIDNNGTVERAAFDWDFGCKVDLAYQVPKKKMDIGAGWTYYDTEGTVTNNVTSPDTLFSVWSIPNLSGTAYEYNSKARSHLIMNMIDFGISTTFSPRTFLDITPFIDLSTVWLRQNFRFDLSGGPGIGGLSVVDDSIDMKNNSWGIGPKFGLNTLWNLGWGFGIAGNFNMSILYTLFDITQNETTTFTGTAPLTYLDISNNKHHITRLNFDLFLGVQWNKLFCQDAYHLLLEAGWENLLFLGQNQLMRFPNQNNPGINTTSNGDLSLEGLSARASLTF